MPPIAPQTTAVALRRGEWELRAEAHRARADELTAGHRARAAVREPHPVWDFLFTYYSYKPSLLRRWHPGVRVVLEDAAETDRAAWRWYRADGAHLSVDADLFWADRGAGAQHVVELLERTASRPPRFGCFGMHEWAMTYRQAEHRHPAPLRLGQRGTDQVVEAHDLRCTHFDAFRFFTPDAVQRNERPLSRDGQLETEQPGCLHAGMDLYKWAVKLGPLVPGEILLESFELARDIRELDMRASPYDLTAWGFSPVAVETAEGKAEYVRQQRGFWARAAGLRSALIAAARA